MFKNTAAKFIVFAFDATTNVPKTGDAANLTAYVSKDYGAVTVLADTTATEFDATNAPGYYWFDAAQTETNGDCLMVTGKSATANIKVIGAPSVIYTRPTTGWLAPATLGRTLVVDAAGLADANVVKVGPTGAGTAQTARDIGTSVLLSTGTGTGQLDFTAGVVKSNLAQILGTALTETAGQIAAAFKQFFNIASPTGTVNLTPAVTTVNGFAANAINAAALAADASVEISAQVAADLATAHGAGTWATATGFATTNPDNAGIAAIKAKTDNLPAAPAAVGDIPTTAAIKTALHLVAITEAYRANGAAPTVEQAICEILGHLAEASIAGTTKTIKKFDHSTTAETFTLNDGTTPTAITRAT